MSLPPFTNKPVPSAGSMAPRCIVIHRAENGLSNGAGLAAYCYYGSPSKYRWHWSVGGGGQAFKHLDWNEAGVHSAGLNDFAAGIEQDGRAHIDPWPDAQVRTTALIVADFCRFIGKAPSRDFIIGHSEDYKFGGTSTHTDPGPAFPWTKFMGYVNDAYAGEEENEVDSVQFNIAVGEAQAYKAAGKLTYAGPIPQTVKEYEDNPEKFKGLWVAVGKARAA